jgi:hypothetical protein
VKIEYRRHEVSRVLTPSRPSNVCESTNLGRCGNYAVGPD